jgi:gamma-aminobutyrate permease
MNQIAAAPQELSRSLRSRHVTMISIGGIIGAGLFVGSGAAIAAVGPAVILSYLAAGLVMLGVMRMLSEMAAASPASSIFTDYVRAGLGPWGGFVCGWLYWYFWVVVVAIEVVAGSRILSEWIPLPTWQIGLAMMVALTAVNLFSTRSYGEFEFWFAAIKVTAIIAFIAIGCAALSGAVPAPGAGLSNLFAHDGFAPKGWSAVAAGVVTVIFAMTGAEIATVAAAESSESARTISRLTMTIVFRIMLFYVGSILVIVAIVPWNTIEPGVSPFATALQRLNIPGIATVMNLVVLTAVMSCLNSGIYISSRILFSLAREGDAPQSLVKLSKRKVPVRAILLGSSLGYVAVMTSVMSASRVFAFLVNASGALTFFIYLLIAFAQIRTRIRLEAEDPQRLVIRMWAFPWLSWLVVVAIVGVLLAMMFDPGHAAELGSSVVSALVVCVAYVFNSRRKALQRVAGVSSP